MFAPEGANSVYKGRNVVYLIKETSYALTLECLCIVFFYLLEYNFYCMKILSEAFHRQMR